MQGQSLPYKVYRITNIKTGKLYIGQTKKDIYVRFLEHCSNAKNPYVNNRSLCWDMYTYGVDNFRVELIAETYTRQQAWDLEAFYIAYFNSCRFGNNDNPGNIAICKKKHPIYFIERYTLRIIAEYESIDYAAELFNVPDSFIYRCCRNLGYIFNNHYWCYTEHYNQLKEHYHNKQKALVVQLDNITHEVLHTFENTSEVALLYNDSPFNITDACYKNTLLHGFLWRFI